MRSSNVVVFGAGDLGQQAVNFLEKLGWTVSAFCDENDIICDSHWYDKLAITLGDYSINLGGGEYPFFIASRNGGKIYDMLMNRGFANVINPLVHQKFTELKPKILEITTVIGCRINCRFCCQDTIVNAYSKMNKNYVMQFDDFKRCIDKAPADVGIHFCGLSEPFLNEHCANMMLYAHKNGHDCWFASTLVNMNIIDCEAIWDIPFKVILIHLPDADGNSYIPITKEYKHVLTIVIALMKKSSGLRVFHCHGPLHPEILDIVQAADMPVSYRVHDRAGHERDEILEHRHIYGDIYCHHNGHLFQYNMLLPDGSVVLCHCDCTMRYILGNLLHDNYESLFLSPVIKDLRSKSIAHDSDILCRTCQDARCVNGDNFPVWEINKWEPYIWMLKGLIFR
jgi:hypothetical protein